MAKGDPIAATFFEEAIAGLASLQEKAHVPEMLAREHYGDYMLAHEHCPSKARPLYDEAKRIAVNLRVGHDSARIQMKIELLELTIDKSPELENFARFKKVAETLECNSEVQHAAWTQHMGAANQSGQGLRHARNKNHASDIAG